MALKIRDAEIFGVTESSLTLSFSICDGDTPVDAEARVVVSGETYAVPGTAGTRMVRIDGLPSGTELTVEIDSPGAEGPEPDAFFDGRVTTLAKTDARQVASFATLNDVHFGEEMFGGVLDPDGAPLDDGTPCVRARDTEVPYWRFMNEDAVEDINSAGVDCTFIKGDIADRGLQWQFEAAAETFGRLDDPWHAFLGNHDYYGRQMGEEADGYALLGQPPAPRAVDLGGWRVLMLETPEPGEHHGVFDDARLAWLSEQLDETHEDATPTLLMTHHQPVPPGREGGFVNRIGMLPAHSVRVFDLLSRHPQVAAMLIGHTHRNRIRRYPECPHVPFVEIHCTKDYPGGWAHYRLFEDGHFRQEARRTSTARALEHSGACRDFFDGGYRRFSLGSLGERSFSSA
ncbi:MAG: metallophosphoesterase [Deltaproteobacteria bacterium]|nr:metallophosphoesterase [Deltaproteobacteria bacterium]MBW2414306.1 metallophosphoesterase [Deltaproteobacteria bacterium]